MKENTSADKVIKLESCINCNGVIREDWKFCPHCQTKLATYNCPFCNEEIRTVWEFCPHCKKNLKNENPNLSFDQANEWLRKILKK